MRGAATVHPVLVTCLPVVFLAGACGPPKFEEVDTILEEIEKHYGQRVTIRARFKSGARCRQTDGQWKTYCKDDCQYCRGPLVVDSRIALAKEGLFDWPMVLGGTWKNRDIRCKGQLNRIECYPFIPGKPYIVRGYIERNRPPKLLVETFWNSAEDPTP